MTNQGRKQRRVSVLDAVDERAHRLARSRTALVRIGQVTLVGTDGTAEVAAGGGTVIAQRFTTAPVVVGDVVALVVDTDAWWILGKLATS
jgi:hypothetical protein